MLLGDNKYLATVAVNVPILAALILSLIFNVWSFAIPRIHLLAAPNGFGCDPKDGAPPPPPPKPPKPPGGDDKEPKPPPPCAADANPLDVPKVLPELPNPPADDTPPNPLFFPFPIAAGEPKVAAPVGGAAAGCIALTPNIAGSRLYFLARLRNNCSSRPAYLFKSLSTSFTLLGLCVW